jgi:Cu(I)/Ag(I) efflux system membrane protein CusA/SilA
MLKSENARPSAGSTWTSAGATCARRSRHAGGGREGGQAPAGYSIAWSGQFEYLERATARLKVVVPATIAIIFVLLYLTFRRADEALSSSPRCPSRWSAASGSLSAGPCVSVASAVGFIALAGVAAEFGVVMLLYLKHAWERAWRRRAASEATSRRRCAKARCCACARRR